MAEDKRSSPLAILGRILSILGYIWVALFFANRADLLAELGIDLGALGENIIPAFVLIAAGRFVRRRGTPKSDEAEARRPVGQQPTPDVAATPPPAKSKPRPGPESREQKRTEVATSLEQALADMEAESVGTGMETEFSVDSLDLSEVAPKTSAEMVEEAKHLFDTPPDSD